MRFFWPCILKVGLSRRKRDCRLFVSVFRKSSLLFGSYPCLVVRKNFNSFTLPVRLFSGESWYWRMSEIVAFGERGLATADDLLGEKIWDLGDFTLWEGVFPWLLRKVLIFSASISWRSISVSVSITKVSFSSSIEVLTAAWLTAFYLGDAEGDRLGET